MAIIYFLQSDVVPTLLDAGVEVLVLTDDETKDRIAQRFARPGLTFEGLRLKEANTYAKQQSDRACNGCSPTCGASAARGASTLKPWTATSGKSGWRTRGSSVWGSGFPLPWRSSFCGLSPSPAIFSCGYRTALFHANLYADLFESHKPDLVIASTAGWRLDRYLLREATLHNVPTMAAIVGWDNPSSYAIRGAPMDYATCWSQLQKDELVYGSDWDPERVHIGGIPSYDGYFRKQWQLPREDYFKLHELDPNRKLISYACSFVHFAPNYPNVEALAKLVSSEFAG